MPIAKDVQDLLDVNQEIQVKHSRVLKLQRFLEQERDRGIIPKKGPRILTLQESERYGYQRFVEK